MNGAQEANQRDFERRIGWQPTQIIALLEKLIQLLLEAACSTDAENGEESEA